MISGNLVEKNDPVVSMLASCKKGRVVQAQLEHDLQKLLERVDLDRPIL